jgi:hypothetical protein
MTAALNYFEKAIAYVDPRYPVTKALSEVFGGYSTGSRRSAKKRESTHDKKLGKRVEIVSGKLCGIAAGQSRCP